MTNLTNDEELRYFRFHKSAVFDIYGSKDSSNLPTFIDNCKDFYNFEKNLAEETNKKFLNITDSIRKKMSNRLNSIYWHYNFSFENGKILRKAVIPKIGQSSEFLRKFHDYRFLFVSVRKFCTGKSNLICSICNITKSESSMFADDENKAVRYCRNCYFTLIKHIHFAGLKYAFLGGALSGKFSNQIDCWYFAESAMNGDKYYSVADARNWLADFDSVKSFFKRNARLKLGFSPTHPCVKLVDSDIILVDDIHGNSSIGNSGTMTDGCGLIHASLARHIPYALSSGIGASSSTDGPLERDHVGLPLVVQIRLSAKKGLFKGCLIVTCDTSICPEGKIMVRESMKKAGGALHIRDDTPCTLAVNNTFEHSLRLNSEFNCTSYYASLSRHLCLYLVHLGVPPERLIALMEQEKARVGSPIVDRLGARNLIKRSLESIDYLREKGDYDSDDDAEDISEGPVRSASSYSDSDDDLPPRYRRLSALYNKNDSQASQAWEFLKSSHELSEPKFSKLLNDLQITQLKRLKKCNLRVSDAQCLVGVPDPCGVLREGEIFVSLPRDFRKSEEVFHDYKPQLVTGKVVVSKYPMNYVGDVRVLTAVSNEELHSFVRETNGGAIFFSTEGKRRVADEMGGGDYDGDLFMVFFSQTDALVTHVQPVAPFDDIQSESQAGIEWDEGAGAESVKREALSRAVPTETSAALIGPFSKEWKSPSSALYQQKKDAFPGGRASFTDFKVDFASLDAAFAALRSPSAPPPPSPSPSEATSDCTSCSSFETVSPVGLRFSSPKSVSSLLSPEESTAKALQKPCEEDLSSQGMFFALVELISPLTVGHLSNACLSFADLKGPQSEEAKACDRYLRSLLDRAKTGERLPKAARDLYDQSKTMRPHYIEGTSEPIRSTSIVGRLYDSVESSVQELKGKDFWGSDLNSNNKEHEEQENPEPTYARAPTRIDPDLAIMHYVKCNLLVKEQSREWESLRVVWAKHCQDYCTKIKNIYQSSESKTGQNKDPSEVEINRKLMDDIIREYIILFDEGAKELASIVPSVKSLDLIGKRDCLACVVYLVAYQRPNMNKFCWAICANELHRHKFDAKKMGEGFSAIKPTLPSLDRELKY